MANVGNVARSGVLALVALSAPAAATAGEIADALSDRLTIGLNYYDSSDGRARPSAVAATSTATGFLRLPNVTNRWQIATISLSYFVTRRLGLTFDLYYERFDVVGISTHGNPLAGGTACLRLVARF